MFQPKRHVRMAERSKALRSGRSPLLWAWVRIPLLTNFFTSLPFKRAQHQDSLSTCVRCQLFAPIKRFKIVSCRSFGDQEWHGTVLVRKNIVLPNVRFRLNFRDEINKYIRLNGGKVISEYSGLKLVNISWKSLRLFLFDSRSCH